MKLLNFIFCSIPLGLLKLALTILGVFLVPIAIPFSKEGSDVMINWPDWRYLQLPKWASPWNNKMYGNMGNDGVLLKARNPFYKNPTGFWSQWYWLALRNPANGLATMSPTNCIQADCRYVKFKGQERVDNGIHGWQFVYAKSWKGRTYTGFYMMWNYYKHLNLEVRIGFKLRPDEATRERPIGLAFIINPFKNWGRG